MSYYFRRFREFLRAHETVKSLLLIAVIILSALAFWGGLRLSLNTEYPMLVVSSGSMCPSPNCVLPVGALIVIHGQDLSQVGLASIIVFRPYPSEADYLVIHRVITVFTPNNGSAYPGQFAFWTHGDANPDGHDQWSKPNLNEQIPGPSLVGVYQFTIPIPYLGSAILSIRSFLYGDSCDLQSNCHLTSQGFLVIIGLVGILLLFEILEPSNKPRSKASDGREKEASDLSSANSAQG